MSLENIGTSIGFFACMTNPSRLRQGDFDEKIRLNFTILFLVSVYVLSISSRVKSLCKNLTFDKCIQAIGYVYVRT
jgi:hypothetical protein